MSTTTQPDRTAIEALARDLNDDGWRGVFAYAAELDGDGNERIRADARALLAYLDALISTMGPGALGVASALACVMDEPATTPLMRAVLKRAKEQGR